MSSARPRPYVILAAVDYSDTASQVVQEAADLARQKHAGQLHFLHVNQASPQDPGQEERHAELLEWLHARLASSQGPTHEVKVVGHEQSGDPAPLIVELASDLEAAKTKTR